MQTLRRELHLPGAVLLGLGSILGTGVFVSIGLAAGLAGPGILPAMALAGLVALLNGLSSAQLAAAHPVSGGTYEYGYRYLNPRMGFAAGWLFICAKSASAATAVLGLTGYLLALLDADQSWRMPVAAVLLLLMTAVVLGGIRRSNQANTVIVLFTLLGLVVFTVTAVFISRDPMMAGMGHTWPPLAPDMPSFFEAMALIFVAYTGYGRIATLGEEVHDPKRTIPRAILITLGATFLLYAAVSYAALASVGAATLARLTSETAAPLSAILHLLNRPKASFIVSIAALTAMAGVTLNLLLGVSRVVYSMGRRADLPAVFGRLDAQDSPKAAVILTMAVMLVLVLFGSIKLAWSFSAFTVLVYYSITNAAALRLPPADRRFPRLFAVAGLLGTLMLAFMVEWPIWAGGLALLLVGWGWQSIYHRIK
jgi:APA family basic amino acid/polyamine antiporter